LHALSTLARDPRPDVRLCAVQTLFRALDAHGAAFPASRWPAVWAVVLPLVQHVLDARARAFASHDHAHPGDDEERRVAEMSGVCLEDPGRLARRQWDEAAETALRGAAGVWAHVRCTERAFVDLWEHVARLAAGSLDPLADAEARAVLRSRQSLAAALECMHVLGDPTLLTSPERRTVPWTAWHRVCLALLTVPAHASTKLNQDAQGFAVVRHDTLCTLLDLGVRLAAVLQDAGELVREQCAALVHVSRAMLMYCEPAETPPREDARVGRLQRLALDAVSLVERGEGLLALRELSLLAAAPYALFLDAPAAGDALLAQRVVGSTREAFGAQLKRAAQLAAACGRPVPSLSALGVAAAEQLVHVAGRLAPEALAPGWQDAVAALALHMVRPVGAPDCFVNAVPEAMLRLQGHGGLQDAWASVALALEHVLGLTASGSTTVHAASEQHVLVLDAVVQVTLQSAQHSQVSAAQPPSELSAYWTRILHVLSCGASLNEGALPAACFRWLLHMCGAGELPTWVSRGAAPVLVKRCRRLVGGFVRERELVGCRAPMPLGRVRLLQGVLEGLAVMECRKGALADETALDTAEVDEDTALDKHTTGVEKDTADVDKDTARPCNNAVAMAKSAVIVALFGALVDLLPAAHASGIVAPVQQCLRRVQHELLG
ncbi:Endocytosis and vacuole integrity protein, partial [Coemansia sp. RSA 2603]